MRKKKRAVTWNTRLAASGSETLPKVVMLKLHDKPELAKRLRDLVIARKCNSYPEMVEMLINLAADAGKKKRLLSQVETLTTNLQELRESLDAL